MDTFQAGRSKRLPLADHRGQQHEYVQRTNYYGSHSQIQQPISTTTTTTTTFFQEYNKYILTAGRSKSRPARSQKAQQSERVNNQSSATNKSSLTSKEHYGIVSCTSAPVAADRSHSNHFNLNLATSASVKGHEANDEDDADTQGRLERHAAAADRVVLLIRSHSTMNLRGSSDEEPISPIFIPPTSNQTTNGSLKSMCDSSGFSSSGSQHQKQQCDINNAAASTSRSRTSRLSATATATATREEQRSVNGYNVAPAAVDIYSNINNNYSNNSSSPSQQQLDSLKQQLNLKSKVIDDLDRLLSEANKAAAAAAAAANSRSRSCCSSSSPTETSYYSTLSSTNGNSGCNNRSHHSTKIQQDYVGASTNGNGNGMNIDIDSTLTRSHEIDYSTLCRDDFSSFISSPPSATIINNNNNNHKMNISEHSNEDAQYRRKENGNDHDETIESRRHLQQEGTVDVQVVSISSQRNGVKRASGPTLIGVHDSHRATAATAESLINYPNGSTRTATDSSDDSSSSMDEYIEEDAEEDCLGKQAAVVVVSCNSSSSCLSVNGRDEEQQFANEQISVDQSFRSSPLIDRALLPHFIVQSNYANHNECEEAIYEEIYTPPPPPPQPSSLSTISYALSDDLLNSYICRMEALLKLTKTKGNYVSMEEAFGGSSDELTKMQISEEFKVETEFSECQQNTNKLQITQEIEMTDANDGDDEEDPKILRNLITKDFQSILSSIPQTSATLNWSEVESNSRISLRCLNRKQIRELEEFILDRFQEEWTGDLVRTVQAHVASFVEGYQEFTGSGFCEAKFDWRQNWLFASKRSSASNSDGNSIKRAKISLEQRNSNETIDLTSYSTLIKNNAPKFKSNVSQRNLIYSQDEDLARAYEAQEELLKELYDVAISSSGQMDVCRMLILDQLFDGEKESTKCQSKPLITISYDNSYLAHCSSFSAHGYLFKMNSSILKLNTDTKKKLLDMIGQLTSRSDKLLVQERLLSNGLESRLELDRVRFLIDLSDAELSTDLRVIQFCSRITGALPISVRWFKQNNNQEIIEISDPTRAKRIKFRENKSIQQSSIRLATNWPVEMNATFDYEYQNEESPTNLKKSFYRFRRLNSDILFEIREPSQEIDFNQEYKCVIENYCSREEQCFRLSSRRKIVKAALRKEMPTLNKPKTTNVAANGKPILRTWSQRTLHKPKLSTTSDLPELESTSSANDLLHQHQQQQQLCKGEFKGNGDLLFKSTLSCDAAGSGGGKVDQIPPTSSNLKGKRQLMASSSGGSSMMPLSVRESQFGKDFPYHPENLLKRLEGNKFSTLTRNSTLVRSRVVGVQASSPTNVKSVDSNSKTLIIDPNRSRDEYHSSTPANSSLIQPNKQFKDSFVAFDEYLNDRENHEEAPEAKLAALESDFSENNSTLKETEEKQTAPAVKLVEQQHQHHRKEEDAAGKTFANKKPNPAPIHPKPRLKLKPTNQATKEPTTVDLNVKDTDKQQVVSRSTEFSANHTRKLPSNQASQQPIVQHIKEVEIEGSRKDIVGVEERLASSKDREVNISMNKVSPARSSKRDQGDKLSDSNNSPPRRNNVRSLISRFSAA